MSMSRKDYVAVAELIKREVTTSPNDSELIGTARMARGLADLFKADNSNFRYDVFFEACGLDPFGDIKPLTTQP